MRVCTLGDLLLDVVVRLDVPLAPDDDVPAAIAVVPGGQAANVAAWVCALGGQARLVARRADDASGRLVAGEVERLGVELAGPVVSGERTGSVVALVARDGTRTLVSDRGSAGGLGPGDIDEAMVAGVDVLHVAGYTLLREPGAEAALRLARVARSYGARVTVDCPRRAGSAIWGRIGCGSGSPRWLPTSSSPMRQRQPSSASRRLQSGSSSAARSAARSLREAA